MKPKIAERLECEIAGCDNEAVCISAVDRILVCKKHDKGTTWELGQATRKACYEELIQGNEICSLCKEWLKAKVKELGK
jgi:hypothetical protein